MADPSSSAPSEPPPRSHERTASISLSQIVPPDQRVGSPPVDGGSGPAAVASPTAADTSSRPLPKEVQEVLESEIGISTLLEKLRQSVSAAKEFAMFLKKRSQLSYDHCEGLKKHCHASQEVMLRADHSDGTFAHAYQQMMSIHLRMAENESQYSGSLMQMQEDLLELAAYAEKNRKGWKHSGLTAEQRVVDVETAMRKSKAKYDQLAEEYDRVRTGDVGQKGRFGFKGPKSAAQHEEDLLRKVQAADQDYHGKVQNLLVERGELLNTTRPEAVKALLEVIKECDSGLALQVQKYASFNEKLLLSNGLAISPMKTAGKPEARSLRSIVTAVDTDKDLYDYLTAAHSKVPARSGEPQYERHPVLSASTQPPNPQYHASQPSVQSPVNTMGQSFGRQQQPQQQPLSTSSRTGTMSFADNPQSTPGQGPQNQGYGAPGPVPTMPAAQRPSSGNQHERSFSHGSAFGQSNPSAQQYPPRNSAQAAVPNSRFASHTSSHSLSGAPQLGALPFQTGPTQGPGAPTSPQSQVSPGAPEQYSSMTNPLMQHPHSDRPDSSGLVQRGQGQGPPQMAAPQMAPARPVFGVSLNRLYERDGLAVPMVVYQCIQAVDLFGLGVEGIYRLSGSVHHVNKLKGMFDTDSSSGNLDFRNPENYFHDVNSVAGLLKQFFRDLPDPLLTKEHYDGFIEAAKNDDDIVRRDSLHAIINSLPDPNYATLRALTLHLHRVTENASVNRMNSQNLAIVFGPTLMGTGAGSNIADAGWQVRVVDTILQNTYQIFDED